VRLVPGERAALSALFEATGPDAPTVLPGWRAEDLLAHLLVRERQPQAAPGILVPALARFTESAMRSYADMPWAERVWLLRDGPPLWSPYRIPAVDERVNLVEFYVHYEDLARAQDGWQPRPSHPERDEALWSALRLGGRVMYRKSPVGVRLRHASRPHAPEITAKRGPNTVTVTGEPGELILHAFGRDQAQVELDGAEADVTALQASPRGI
jgi:uncharacterized protein (TIGR03085 family)